MEPIVGQIPIPDAVNVLRTGACGSRPIHPSGISTFADPQNPLVASGFGPERGSG